MNVCCFCKKREKIKLSMVHSSLMPVYHWFTFLYSQLLKKNLSIFLVAELFSFIQDWRVSGPWTLLVKVLSTMESLETCCDFDITGSRIYFSTSHYVSFIILMSGDENQPIVSAGKWLLPIHWNEITQKLKLFVFLLNFLLDNVRLNDGKMEPHGRL